MQKEILPFADYAEIHKSPKSFARVYLWKKFDEDMCIRQINGMKLHVFTVYVE
jgi:hypothetical protein